MNQGERRVCVRNSSAFLQTSARCLNTEVFSKIQALSAGAFRPARGVNPRVRAQTPESKEREGVHPHFPTDRAWGHAGGKTCEEVESACKPGSVRLATRQSFLSARRHRLAPATYPGTTRAALSFPYLVLLRVGFTVPYDVSPVRGALLPHPFTLTTHIRRCRSAVCSLLHWPSAHAAQELPGTLPCGARTFLDALARDATVRPTPRRSIGEASSKSGARHANTKRRLAVSASDCGGSMPKRTFAKRMARRASRASGL